MVPWGQQHVCLCPQDWNLQAGLLGLLHAALCPRLFTASPSKAETRDHVCHFKDLHELFSRPHLKGGLEKLAIIITFQSFCLLLGQATVVLSAEYHRVYFHKRF